MKHMPMPDLNYLKSILDYDPDTGEFRWKVSLNRRIKIDSIAGHLHIDKTKPNNNYYRIKINRKEYLLHRLAYYYITGIDPAENEVDHKNGDTLENKFKNLRLGNDTNTSQNQKKFKNNTSGFKGVVWKKQYKKWNASRGVNNKRIHLGYFDNKFYAALVYARAAKQYFGDWRRVI